MSNNGLARQAVSGSVSYQFKDYSSVEKFVGHDIADDMKRSLNHGERVDFPFLTRVKGALMIYEEDDDSTVRFWVSAIVTTVLLLTVLAFFTNLSENASLYITTPVAFVVSNIFKYKGAYDKLGIERAPLNNAVSAVVSDAEKAVDRLNKSDVWNDKKNYPDVERFDTKKVLQNVREMADTVNVEFQKNSKIKPKNSKNFKEFQGVVNNLTTIANTMDEISAKNRELVRASEDVTNVPVSLNDNSSLIVESAMKNNKAAVEGFDVAIRRTLPTQGKKKSKRR